MVKFSDRIKETYAYKGAERTAKVVGEMSPYISGGSLVTVGLGALFDAGTAYHRKRVYRVLEAVGGALATTLGAFIIIGKMTQEKESK